VFSEEDVNMKVYHIQQMASDGKRSYDLWPGELKKRSRIKILLWAQTSPYSETIVMQIWTHSVIQFQRRWFTKCHGRQAIFNTLYVRIMSTIYYRKSNNPSAKLYFIHDNYQVDLRVSHTLRTYRVPYFPKHSSQ
jgi:hypothetical protein